MHDRPHYILDTSVIPGRHFEDDNELKTATEEWL